MPAWSRIANVFRGDRLNREIDEELQAHIDEAIAAGRDPAEARRAFGSPLRRREQSRDVRLAGWLDALRSDVIFGWRQLRKRKATSAAAALSLALAIGSCASAFRLIDALLLRPLPVRNADRLYALSFNGIGFDGNARTSDSCEYPMFQQMRAAVQGEAELLAFSYSIPYDITYGSDQDMEKAHVQYVSGRMFEAFGIQPALGRVLAEADDITPGARPYAVLSYDYWTRRFARDPHVLGRRLRIGADLFEIAGVTRDGFSGVQPGAVTAVFIPTMMHPRVRNPNSTWFRTMVQLRAGVAPEPVRQKLYAVFRSFREERAKALLDVPRQSLDHFINHRLLLEPAPAGVSTIQRDYRQPLLILSVLVTLVLLIACANVANLMAAHAAARAREMALRVSIGAGRWRLVQLVLVEGGILGCFAAAGGACFAWWSAPFVVNRINPPSDPARLYLPVDWRVVAFSVSLTFVVILLFGLAPALSASAIQPASSLRGGADPRSRRRTMRALAAAQAGFCALVLFACGLFVTTFGRLSRQSTGFSADRLLTIEVVSNSPQPIPQWDHLLDHLRGAPGVEKVALADWALLSGGASLSLITVGGKRSNDPVWHLDVSPGWLETMKIPLLHGRDFRPDEVYPKAAIVNESFARQFFGDRDPVGQWFSSEPGDHLEIVGVVRDVRYLDLRGPMPVMAFFPFRSIDSKSAAVRPRRSATVMVRTSSDNPLALAQTLRREVTSAWPAFRASNISTQEELIRLQIIRERLLALLALFFGAVALLLAGVGMYGVLDYSVVQRRREIGIRMAIGAQAADIARRVALDTLVLIVAGSLAGLGAGVALARYVEALLFQVKATDAGMLAAPWLAILGAALAAASPAVIRAVRIDPASILRMD